MKVLILNGSNKGDVFSQQLVELFVSQLKNQNNQYELVNLQEAEIASCLGCFGCWVKTPGVCVIDDPAREIARQWVKSDLVITICPITFGGYSYELKKALDRSICNISPFFKKIKGEVHHKKRYDRYPKMISVGTLPANNPEYAATFQQLVSRNAINMHNPVYTSRVLIANENSNGLNGKIADLLKEVGGVS